MSQKTMYLEKQTYFVYQAGTWEFLVRRDRNSSVYIPFCRKGWQDGGEVEIFSLLPPETAGDEPLLHIRIYTKANEADRVLPLSNPSLSIQSELPAFTYIEPEQQRVRIQLLCVLSLEGRRLRITPMLEPENFKPETGSNE